MNMLKVGITGNMGSGKTTVCQIFEVLGIPVYYADERAKQLMVEEEDLVAGIKALFGPEAYHDDGSLNRDHIARKAFSDPDKLKQLNGLVHPAVARDTLRWQAGQEKKKVPYTLREAALLYESGSDKWLDKIIVVSAPENIRIQRVMKRDRSSEKEIKARMDKQMPEAEKVARADFVIQNDGSRSLIEQVIHIHQQLVL